MIKFIYIFILIFPLLCVDTWANSCLNQGILGIIKDKNSIEYLEQAFPLCVHQKQCSPATEALNKLKNIDPVKYSFLMGSALANGDCFTKDLSKAEKLLSFCSQYSLVCRKNLFNFYYIYAKDRANIKQYALHLAAEGYPPALYFLVELYISNGKDKNLPLAYFWADVACFSADKGISKTNTEIEIAKNIGNDLDIYLQRINILKREIANFYSIMKDIEKHISPSNIKKINTLAKSFADNIELSIKKNDPLQNISYIYAVTAVQTAKSKNKKDKLAKISPPQLSLSVQLEQCLRALEEIRQ